MYDYTLHCGRKQFCRYHLQAFSTEEILKSHIKDRFKVNGIIMPKKGEYVKFRNYERKIKSPFMICADFEYSSVFQWLKIIERKIQMSLILTNIQNMLLVFMVIAMTKEDNQEFNNSTKCRICDNDLLILMLK